MADGPIFDDRVVAGRAFELACDLGPDRDHVKLHRDRMTRKMGVRTVADLVRMAERAGIRPEHKEVGKGGRT